MPVVTALPAPLAPGHPCNDACRKALHAICVCSCNGRNHGSNHGFGLDAQPRRASRNPFAGLPVPADIAFGEF